MKTKVWILATLVFTTLGFSAPETRTITGTVTSAEDGSALPGVNVLLKGTSTGTATDAGGKYSIQVPVSGGTLVFSFIGLVTQEIKSGTRSVVDVSMTMDVTQLSETVVTGYAHGVVKRGKSKAGAKYAYEAAPTTTAPNDMYQQPQNNTEEY